MAAHLVQVKGSTITGRLQWLKEEYGAHGLRELEAELSPAGRALVRGDLDPRGWVNYPLFIEIISTLDRRFGSGDGSLNIEMARFGVHHNTPRFFQAFIKLGSIDWILARASKLWDELFTAGRFVVRHEPGAHKAEGEILDFPAPHLCLTYAALGFCMGAIELSGGKDVQGEVVAARARGAERDLLRVSWS
jgi:hypothetical protein